MECGLDNLYISKITSKITSKIETTKHKKRIFLKICNPLKFFCESAEHLYFSLAYNRKNKMASGKKNEIRRNPPNKEYIFENTLDIDEKVKIKSEERIANIMKKKK